jgi:hypothetical protein
MADPTKAEPRSFEIRLTDLNTGDAVQGIITTNQPVTLDQIDRQGGVIVEGVPACTQDELNKGQCTSNPYPAHNGLAQFDNSIQVSNMTLLTDSTAATWSYYEWVMQRIADPTTGETHQLAQNSDPAGTAPQGISFTVTWLSRY